MNKRMGELKSENERLRAENKWLGELLAIIHRDGGHYIDEHGLEKAVLDAMDMIPRLRASLDETEKRASAKRASFAVQMMAAWRATDDHPDDAAVLARFAVADADALIAALGGMSDD